MCGEDADTWLRLDFALHLWQRSDELQLVQTAAELHGERVVVAVATVALLGLAAVASMLFRG